MQTAHTASVADPVAESVRRLRASLQAERIYLFGSRARGEADEDSDYDFLVVVRDSPLPRYKREQQAFRALCGMGIAKDVVVFAREQLYVTHPLRCFTQPRAKADTVTFEADGNAEWRLLPVAAEVRIGCGVARRLSDAGMAVLDAGTTLPATVTACTVGCYLQLFGAARTNTTVTVAPAACLSPGCAGSVRPR